MDHDEFFGLLRAYVVLYDALFIHLLNKRTLKSA